MPRTNWRKQCSICGHRFSMLRRHLNVAHSGGKHRCKICPCAFHSPSGLDHHIRQKHDGNRNEYLLNRSLMRPMNVPDQSKVSASKLSKRAAISRLNSRPIASSFTAKSTRPELVTELASRKYKKSPSRDIRVVCEDCGNTVYQKDLENHLQSLHRGGEFACNLCPCSGFSLAALTNHKRRHYRSKRQPIPTYLTHLKWNENYEARRLKISSVRRSSSVEILYDQVQKASACCEGSCSPEILTTFCNEGSSLDSNRAVSIEPDASGGTPKKSLSMETSRTERNQPAAAAVSTFQRPVMGTFELVEQKIAHPQRLTSSSSKKELEPATNIPMRPTLFNKTSLPFQAAAGKNSIDFHTKHKGNVTYFVGHDSEIICVDNTHGEPISTTDFNGKSSAIRPGTAVQIPFQSSFPTCHLCNTMFVSPAALGNHMKTHVAVCGYCGKTVPTLDIAAHMPDCASAVVGRSSASSSRQ